MNRVFCILEDDCEEEEIGRIEKDDLIKVYEGLQVGKIIFCLEKDKEYLENKYNVRFCNAVNVLFYLLLGENDNVLDLDLMFYDNCSLYNESINEDDFDFQEWIKTIKALFYENCIFMLNNYNLCEVNYYNILNIMP